MAGSCFQLVYYLPAVLGGGIVVGGGFVGGGFFVAAVEAAADFVGALTFPFIFLLVRVILIGAHLLRLFIHPVMRPPSLAWFLPPTLCGIAGVSLFSRRIGAFFFFISNFLEIRQYRELMGRVGCTSCVVEYGVGVRNIAR